MNRQNSENEAKKTTLEPSDVLSGWGLILLAVGVGLYLGIPQALMVCGGLMLLIGVGGAIISAGHGGPR